MLMYVFSNYIPVEPNPPEPRNVLPRSSSYFTNSTSIGSRFGAHIWNKRVPGSILYEQSEILSTNAPNFPRYPESMIPTLLDRRNGVFEILLLGYK